MYCYNCGKINDATCVYCYNCGAQLSEPQVEIQQNDEAKKDRVRSALRRYLASPLLLIALILMTVSFVLGLIPAGDMYYEDTPEYEDEGGGYAAPLSVDASVQQASDISDEVVFSLIDLFDMSLPWLVAGCLIYFSARSKKAVMNTAGLGMAKVLALINKIICFICCGFIGLLFVIALIEIFAEGDAYVTVMSIILLLPLLAGAGFFAILCTNKMHTAFKSLLSIYQKGDPSYKLPVLVGVMLFVAVGFSSLGIDMSVFGTLSGLTGAAANILLGVLYFRLRSGINAVAKELKSVNIPVIAGQINNNDNMI